MRYIRRKHGDYFCVGVAAYPEGHADSADKLSDVDHLRAKVEAGADFVVTQLFYDVDRFLAWYSECQSKGMSLWPRASDRAGVNVPIVPGIMPIQSFATFRRMTTLCQSTAPDEVLSALQPIAHDDQAVKDYGVRLAVDMIRRLRAAGLRGFHISTLNLERSVRRILDELDWVAPVQSNAKTAVRRRSLLSS